VPVLYYEAVTAAEVCVAAVKLNSPGKLRAQTSLGLIISLRRAAARYQHQCRTSIISRLQSMFTTAKEVLRPHAFVGTFVGWLRSSVRDLSKITSPIFTKFGTDVPNHASKK